MSPSDALYQIGLEYNTKICAANPHIILMNLMTGHCKYMAEHKQLGHQNFDERYQICREKLGINCGEIAAMSWAGNYMENSTDEQLLDIARQMWKSWRYSRGHWEIAQSKCKYSGGDMCQADNGTWYAAMIGGR